MLGRTILAIALIFVIIYVIPFVVYSIFTAAGSLKPPEGVPPGQLLLSFAVQKIATAAGFVLLFVIARESIGDRWLLYAGLWWAMFIIVETGQAIGPHYTWTEALAGIISETAYFPLAGLVLRWLFGVS